MTDEAITALGKRVLDATLITCIAAAVCITAGLAGVQWDRLTSEPYAPTRANPTVAGVDAAGENTDA